MIFIVIIVILADMGKLPRFLHSINDIRYGDKIGHFALFGLLCFLSVRALLAAFPHLPPLRVAFVVGLTLALLVAVEEYSQNFFTRRTADWVDLFAGYGGMFIGAAAALKLPSAQK